MALPNEVQVGRYNRFVQKLLSIKGKATTYLASPELDFVVSLFHGAENRYLEGWDLFSTDISPNGAGAGNLTAIQVRNPLGSNMVAVVYRFTWFEATATNGGIATSASLQQFRSNTSDQVNIITARGWDGRGRPGATLVVSYNSASPPTIPAGGVGIALATTPANTVADFLLAGNEIPLLPGAVLMGISGNTNVVTNAAIWWRERFLEDSERT